jgi:hypothetical protein
MVVTTGDGYVASAEPQLRENSSYTSVMELYSPSPSQLENKGIHYTTF